MPVQSISSNTITMQQPGWNNNTFGYDTLTSPFRAGPMYLVNAYEFLDAAGEWYLDTGHRRRCTTSRWPGRTWRRPTCSCRGWSR